MVSMIDVSLRDVASSACGRAVARTSAVIAASSSPAGTHRRQRERSGMRLLDQRQAREGHGVLAPPPPRPEVRTAITISGTTSPSERERPEEAHGQITRPYQRIESPAAARNSKQPAGGEEGGDLGLAAGDGELEVDAVVDLAQGGGVARR